jgi:hypothetical protein
MAADTIEPTPRPRAADDFEAIRQRLGEIQREARNPTDAPTIDRRSHEDRLQRSNRPWLIALQHHWPDLLKCPWRSRIGTVESKDDIEAIVRPVTWNILYIRCESFCNCCNVLMLPGDEGHATCLGDSCGEVSFFSLLEAKIDLDREFIC